MGEDTTSPVEEIHGRLLALRSELTRAAAANPRVWSLDGTTFQFDVVRDTPLLVGGYVVITTRDGRSLVGQVTSSVPTEREGPRIAIDLTTTGAALPGGSTVSLRMPIRATAGGGPILGRLEGDRLVPPSREGFDDAQAEPAPPAAIAAVVASGDATGRITLGSALVEPTAPIGLQAEGFGRHTFVCGQSGSGKTYALGKILEQLLLHTSLPLVVLDPNSDYITLTEPRQQEETGLDADAYREQTDRLAALAPRIHVLGGDPAPVAVRFGRLSPNEQALVFGIDAPTDTLAYGALRNVTAALGEDATLAAVLSALADGDEVAQHLGHRGRALGVDAWSIWADEEDRTVADRLSSGWRAAIVDLGALGTAAERSVVSAAVLDHLWRRRYERAPHLIVIDEAHNVCPAVPASAAEAAAASLVRSIAAEGRKYGLYLLLSTQEPHKVHPDVLSQCANLLLMRTTSRAALEQLQAVFSDIPPGLLDLAPQFTLGQGVVAGRIAPHPLAFKTGRRLTRDGGRDVPADWTTRTP